MLFSQVDTLLAIPGLDNFVTVLFKNKGCQIYILFIIFNDKNFFFVRFPFPTGEVKVKDPSLTQYTYNPNLATNFLYQFLADGKTHTRCLRIDI